MDGQMDIEMDGQLDVPKMVCLNMLFHVYKQKILVSNF